MERIVEREVSMKILSFGSLNIDYVYKVSHFVKKGETLSAAQKIVASPFASLKPVWISHG